MIWLLSFKTRPQVPPQAKPEQSAPHGQRFSPGCGLSHGGRLRSPERHRVCRGAGAGEPHEGRLLRGLPRERCEGCGFEDSEEEGRHVVYILRDARTSLFYFLPVGEWWVVGGGVVWGVSFAVEGVK